jgi:hypothetical protein
MMQSGQDRKRDNATIPLDHSIHRRIFLQRQLRARPVVITGISGENSPQMRLAEDQHVIQAFPTQCADQTFRNSILPRRSCRNRMIAHTHRLHPTLESVPVGAVIVAHQVGRC